MKTAVPWVATYCNLLDYCLRIRGRRVTTRDHVIKNDVQSAGLVVEAPTPPGPGALIIVSVLNNIVMLGAPILTKV